MDEQEMLLAYEMSGIDLEIKIQELTKILQDIDQIGHSCNGIERFCKEISQDEDIQPAEVWNSKDMSAEKILYHRLREEMGRAHTIRKSLKNIQDQVKESLEQKFRRHSRLLFAHLESESIAPTWQARGRWRSMEHIKNLKLETTRLETLPNEEFSLYTPVTFDFYWEQADSLEPNSNEERDEAHKELGKQLMAAIWKERTKNG